MPTYCVFGDCLRSPLDFPELTPTSDPARWTLEIVDEPPGGSALEHLGEAQVNAEANVHLVRTADGFRLTYDDTGTFDVTSQGTLLSWVPRPDAKLEAVRADVLGRVLALALHMSGELVLHGSAVSIEGEAVAFLAPKHHGKSTLAMALLAKGARLIGDDALPVDLGPPIQAHPGVHSLRLWEDVLSRFGDPATTLTGPGGKHTVVGFSDRQLEHHRRPLRALYLLLPDRAPGPWSTIRRAHLDSVKAAVSLVRHAKIGELLGGSQAPIVLERATAVARECPVYTLRYGRGFGVLGALADRILTWSKNDAARGAGSTNRPDRESI